MHENSNSGSSSPPPLPQWGNEGSQNSIEAKTGLGQLVKGLFSLLGSLVGLGFIVWFMNCGSGHIRVPLPALLIGLVLGLFWFVDGLRRIIWAYRVRGIIVAIALGLISIGAAFGFADEQSYNEVLKYLPVDGFIDSDKVIDYAKSHTWSPRCKQLDERVWQLTADKNFSSPYVRFYNELPAPRLHQVDIDKMKERVLASLRQTPDVSGCRWYMDCFAGPNGYTRSDPPEIPEVRDILFRAVQNSKPPLSTLTPPITVLQLLAKKGKTNYSLENNDGQADVYSAVEAPLQTCMSMFCMPWSDRVDSGGNIRLKFDWQDGSGVSTGNGIQAPSKKLQVTISIFSDSGSVSPDWTASQSFETPQDLQKCIYESNDEIPTNCTIFKNDDPQRTVIAKATLQQFLLARPFSYFPSREFNYSPPRP